MVDLRLGDCLDILPALPDASVDCICADPPYGTTASCKWDSVIPFEPMWDHLKRIIKPRGAIVLFGSQPFTSALVMSNPAWFRYEWVWEKNKATGHLDATRRPLRAHESILVFAKQSTNYVPQMETGTPYEGSRRGTSSAHLHYGGYGKFRNDNPGVRYPRSVLKFGYATDSQHPTQKPVALMEYLVRTYTNDGDTVLDFCFGSGTTGVACVNTGRNFIGIERDESYFAIAQRRIHDAQYKLELSPTLPLMEVA